MEGCLSPKGVWASWAHGDWHLGTHHPHCNDQGSTVGQVRVPHVLVPTIMPSKEMVGSDRVDGREDKVEV